MLNLRVVTTYWSWPDSTAQKNSPGDPVTVSGESPDEIRNRYNAYYISVLSRQPLTLSTWQDQHEFLLGDLGNLRVILAACDR